MNYTTTGNFDDATGRDRRSDSTRDTFADTDFLGVFFMSPRLRLSLTWAYSGTFDDGMGRVRPSL